MNHINAPSIGQGSSCGSENLQAAQPPAWVQQVAQRNPHLTPEVARAEAQAEHMKALAEAQRERRGRKNSGLNRRRRRPNARRWNKASQRSRNLPTQTLSSRSLQRWTTPTSSRPIS